MKLTKILTTLLSSALILTGCSSAKNLQSKQLSSIKQETTTQNNETSTHKMPILTQNDKSNIQDGSVKYGAKIILANLDNKKRPHLAHMQVKESQLPSTNGEKRNEKINVNPAGWHNYKINGQWVNDRSHLLGYQFSGLNDELRNLVYGTAYLNRGTEGKGSDAENQDSMLFYEQRLAKWLHDNPSLTLDYVVKPIYEGDELVPRKIYMQWIGVKDNGTTIPIKIDGKSKIDSENYSFVTLDNVSHVYKINYTDGTESK
jgi:streptodornase